MLIVEIENASQHLSTILQYFKQEADAKKEPAVVPISALSDFFDDQGISINTDLIKKLIDTDPKIKNVVNFVSIFNYYNPFKLIYLLSFIDFIIN